MLHTIIPNQCACQVSTFYTVWFLRYSPDKILNVQGHYNKVKGQINALPSCCQPTLPTNVPTKCQLPIPYSFRDIAHTRFERSQSQQQGQIKITRWGTPTPPVQSPYQ